MKEKYKKVKEYYDKVKEYYDKDMTYYENQPHIRAVTVRKDTVITKLLSLLQKDIHVTTWAQETQYIEREGMNFQRKQPSPCKM